MLLLQSLAAPATSSLACWLEVYHVRVTHHWRMLVLAFLTRSSISEDNSKQNTPTLSLQQCSNQTHFVPMTHEHWPATVDRPHIPQKPELCLCDQPLHTATLEDSGSAWLRQGT